jgi:hypothetical protein
MKERVSIFRRTPCQKRNTLRTPCNRYSYRKAKNVSEVCTLRKGVSMIRTSPKPLSPSILSRRKPERLPKRKGMTLALAMVCEGGLILAADTRVSYQDGSIGDMSKITGFQSPNGTGTYIIVHSSHDANAANTLIADIRQGLEDNRFPESLPAVEAVIKGEMWKWYVPVHDDRPLIQLLIGAYIRGQSKHALYLCEPPNTVSPVYETYKAIGGGYLISDPIYKWFEDRAPWSAHASLCQISYMMYRAKKMHPGTIGGHTDVGFLTDPVTVPYWINRLDMVGAESHGLFLDRHISNFASLIVGKSGQDMQAILRTAEGIHSCAVLYGSRRFKTQFEHFTISP